MAAPQSALDSQSTHCPIVVLQIGLSAQSSTLRHSTHTPFSVSQVGASSFRQSSSPSQAKPQTCSMGEQVSLTAQSSLSPHSMRCRACPER
jgi:hypothetical protein